MTERELAKRMFGDKKATEVKEKKGLKRNVSVLICRVVLVIFLFSGWYGVQHWQRVVL